MKKRIRYKYKVVRIFEGSNSRQSAYSHKFSKYNIKYTKGEYVKALDGSFGIFCFKRLRDAKDFITSYLTLLFNYKIIRIIPIGKGF